MTFITPAHIRRVRGIAHKRKGLTKQQFRDRMAATGHKSIYDFTPWDYKQFVDGLNKLPDVPGFQPPSRPRPSASVDDV